MIERDKYLTEAMGECWHTIEKLYSPQGIIYGERCAAYKNINFSTWTGFGKLWEWAQKQDWLEEFLNIMDVGEYIHIGESDFTFDLQSEFVNPDRFANAVYEFLKEYNGE